MRAAMHRPVDLLFGGDYNPEQWPRAVWRRDVELMAEAGVNLVSVGIFAWSLLEPEPGRFELEWLDDVLDTLDAGGVGVDLATGTAATPPWLVRRHPEIRPVDAGGRVLDLGSRQTWCPSSPVYREHAVRLATVLARRYSDHPALRMWHVGNEYGCHVARCWCPTSATAFRAWLAARYGDIETLNAAWSTAFWSQRYASFDEVGVPGATPTFTNPAQLVDFDRFGSEELLGCFVAERDVLHIESPGVPVTTNFMVMRHFAELDYWQWADEVDLVTNDHYVTSDDPRPEVELALSADITRGLAGGRPWLLMEHSTSAVNWQSVNRPKRPGEMARHSLQHVGRGSDGALFFQWRQSEGGAERHHSAMVPHAGTDSRVWREVCDLGAVLRAAGPLSGSEVPTAEVALVYDFESAWFLRDPTQPSDLVDYRREVEHLYAAFWRGGVPVDVVRPGADLRGRRLVLVPAWHAVDRDEAAWLEDHVRDGATVLVTFQSGITDRAGRVHLGGYPGVLRDLLGVRVEEFAPLLGDQVVALSDGSVGSVWSEVGRAEGAEVLIEFAADLASGSPAVTRHRYGTGTAWYLATRLEEARIDALVAQVCDEAGVARGAGDGVERMTRRSASGETWTVVVNHGDTDRPLGIAGDDVRSGLPVEADTRLSAGGATIVRSPRC